MSNELNYAGDYDFDNLVTALENRLKATDAWKDTYKSATGQMLIEFHAFVANMVLFYLERRAEECYWSTAQNRSSLFNLARLINYTPKRVISSVGSLQFSIATVSANRIYIPQYTSCQTVNGIKFVTIMGTTIEPGQTSNTVDAIQGELVTLSYTGDGTAGQEYVISSTTVENDTHTGYLPWTAFRVIVDGVEWSKVSSFLSSSNVDTHYILRAELDETLTIIFGDDIKGKAPEIGSVIQIKYIDSDGVDGNVYETGKVTTLNSTLYDSTEAEVTVTVTNSGTLTGGDAAEDLEEIRSEAPNVFATGDRLVTKLDFKAFILNYESVADVNVWGEAEESSPNYDMYNLVKLCILLGDFELPTTSFKTTLSDDLYDKSMITVKYEYVDAEILYVIPVVELYVVAGNALSQAESDVNDAIAAEFVLGSTTKLGTSKFKSNLVEAADSLSAISYLHMTLVIRKELTESEDSGDDIWEATLDATSVLAESVDVYVGDTVIATDDGLGEFTDSSSGYTVSGTINYTTGAVSVDISPTPDETVSVRYQQDSDGDIIVDNDQICKLYEVDVDSVGYES